MIDETRDMKQWISERGMLLRIIIEQTETLLERSKPLLSETTPRTKIAFPEDYMQPYRVMEALRVVRLQALNSMGALQRYKTIVGMESISGEE